MINNVGPTAKMNRNKRPATTILILLKIFIPLSTPLAADIIKQIETMMITMICTHVALGMLVKWEIPPVICMALKPNVVATPVHVASTANVSMVCPIQQSVFLLKLG